MTLDQLLLSLKNHFTQLVDVRRGYPTISLVNALLSGVAIYSLKYSSLLSFIQDMQAGLQNLRQVYHITQPMSDTGMRQVLDKVSTATLQPLLGTYVKACHDAGLLRTHQMWQQYYYIAIDGTQYYKSKQCKCSHCLVKKHRDQTRTYHHNALAGVLLHPTQRTVFPVALEDICKPDGQTKNDCELAAVQRLLPQLRTALPTEKIIIGGDALFCNGPFIRSLQRAEHAFAFVLSIKEGNQPYPFLQFKRAKETGDIQSLTLHTGRKKLCLEWSNGLALNPSHQDLKINFIHCTEQDQKTGQTKIFDFITDLKVTKQNVAEWVQLGRSRWKIENETFNTLKNQGYHFEHNFGHGKHHLASNFAQLMMIAFLFDQIQQHTNPKFKAALLKTKTKKKLWQQVRAIFMWIPVASMQDILQLIAKKHQVKIQYLI